MVFLIPHFLGNNFPLLASLHPSHACSRSLPPLSPALCSLSEAQRKFSLTPCCPQRQTCILLLPTLGQSPCPAPFLQVSSVCDFPLLCDPHPHLLVGAGPLYWNCLWGLHVPSPSVVAVISSPTSSRPASSQFPQLGSPLHRTLRSGLLVQLGVLPRLPSP